MISAIWPEYQWGPRSAFHVKADGTLIDARSLTKATNNRIILAQHAPPIQACRCAELHTPRSEVEGAEMAVSLWQMAT